MSANRKFILKAILYGLFAIILCALPNLLIDPQHLFRKDFNLPLTTEPNLHFKKMEFIINNKDKYDSFIFGSSAIELIDPSKIPASAGRFYNMYYSEGVPAEYLDDIRILLKNGVKMKCMLIGLDFFSYKVDLERHASQWMRHPYEDSWLKRIFFLLRYVLSPVSAQRWGYLNALFNSPGQGALYNISKRGNVTWSDQAVKRLKNHEIKLDLNKPWFYAGGGRLGKTVEELQEIINIANANNIKTVIFINPIYWATYLNIDHDDFFKFKKNLAQITDYYDFSGISPVARDNCYFFDMFHYNSQASDMVISRIFNINIGQIPLGFGVFVTRDNIDEHIVDQKKEITNAKEQGY